MDLQRQGRLRTSQAAEKANAHAAGSRPEWLGLALLACALAFNAVCLAPELRVGQPAWNDSTFHLAAAERLGQSLSRGEPFLDPWVSEWSLGYPVWRTYQPLPHLFAAGVLRLTEPFLSHTAAFAALQYVLLVCLPLSAYCGARLLGLGPLGCGLAALLILAPTGTGDFASYGIGYAAIVRNGSGLYTQLCAVHLLVLSLGAVRRAVDAGRMRITASVLLVAAALSHIVFGYVAFVSAALWAAVGPRDERARRLVRLLTIIVPALLLLAWFVVPLIITRSEVNHSRWEPAFKWDSFGAETILRALCSGDLLDGGRFPVLTLLVGAGALMAAWARREVLPRRLLALAVLWLVLFFGRVTWGRLLILVAVPADFHLHRLQAASQLAAVLLAAWGIERALRAAATRSRALVIAMAAGVVVALTFLGIERAHYLGQNASSGEASRRAYEREKGDLDQALAMVRTILAERHGRVSAGRRSTWGDQFRIGDLRVYTFVTLAHLDQVSFLYHSMSLTSDVMELRDETDPAHDVVFAVRALIAPVDQPPQPHWRRRGRYGRFAVYECSPEGYFGVVDIGGRYTGPRSTMDEPSAAWLQSTWLRQGVVLALDDAVPNVPAVARWQPFPPASPAMLAPCGRVLSESKDGETYRARLLLERDCYGFVKITWDPALVAAVDGHAAPIVRVTPGFAAVPVPAGAHAVEVRYRPGPLRPLLLALGLLLFVGASTALHAPGAGTAEKALASWLARWARPLATPAAASALLLLGLMLLALHALFRGQLINGHDATAYPPRLVEFGRAVNDGQIPPLWAADLGNGHGQPLFEFAPPLLYLAAYPFHVAGCGLTDALQLALAVLCMAGALAVYGLGRRSGAARGAALGGAAAWLFAPYVALDLYVRAAFAEAAAVAMAPVAILGLATALDQPSAARIALAAALVALVPLAHNAVALLVLPVLALFVLAQRSWRAGVTGAVVLTLGLALSAFFWLPALLEKDFIKSELLREGYLHWSVHAIDAFQLLWSPWGYGLSVPGPNDGMSFAVGPIHLLLAVFGVAVVWRSGAPARRREAAAFALAALAGAWLATSWSAPVWSHVETLRYLTHPWRALCLPATFLPLLIVPALDWLGPRTRIWAVVALVGVNLAHTAPKGFLTYDQEYYLPNSIAEKGLNTTTYEEYEPHWVSARPPHTTQHLTGQPSLVAVQPVALQSAHQEFIVWARGTTVVEAATFYYPGWRVLVDGQDTAIAPSPGRGTISFHLPQGTHRIVLDLQKTPVRRLADLVTLVVAAALLLIAVGICLVARAGRGLG